METQGGESAAESVIAMALCLVCQTQEQHMQAHAQQTRAIIDMAKHQAGDRDDVRELLMRTAGNLAIREGTAGAPLPAAEADRPLTISLPKMTQMCSWRSSEAVPLHSISTKSVAQALFQLISRVGIPKEILTDQGTAFMSRTRRKTHRRICCKNCAREQR